MTSTHVNNTPNNLQVMTHGGDLLITFSTVVAVTAGSTGTCKVVFDNIGARIHTYYNSSYLEYTGQIILGNIAPGWHTLNIEATGDSGSTTLSFQKTSTQSLTIIEL